MINDATIAKIAQDTARLNYPLPFKDAFKLYQSVLKTWGLHSNEDLDSVMLTTYVIVNRNHDAKRSKISYYFYLSLKNNIKAHIRTTVKKSVPTVTRPESWDTDFEDWNTESISYNLEEWVDARKELTEFRDLLTDKENEFITHALKGLSIPKICALMEISESRGYQYFNKIKKLWKDRHTVSRSNRGKAKATHCKNGHLYTPETEFITNKGWRVCRACHRMYYKNHSLRKAS